MTNKPFEGSSMWVWSAEGCWGKQPDGDPYRVRYFRRTFEVPHSNCQLTVHVSADSRYVLWCNGVRVSRGPAKGDLAHQFYDTVDLTPYLRQGRNVLAVQVVSFADSWPILRHGGGPCSVMTAMGAFILDGHLSDRQGQSIEALHTPSRWRVLADQAYHYKPCPTHFGAFTGMGEIFDGSRYPWGWQEVNYDDSRWESVVELERGYTAEAHCDSILPYRLLPRMIPFLEETDGGRFSRTYGADTATQECWQALIAADAPLEIAPRSQAHIGLDAGALTTAYPVLKVKGGLGAEIKLTYGEAQWREGKKGHRDDLAWGTLDGIFDTYFPGGGAETWEPFLWRSFRLVELDIVAGEEPLTIESLTYRFTAYPFKMRGAFECSDSILNRMWEVSWRTARLCAHETYEDCPTYEQLQYAGDTQVQTLISYAVAGDARLARQALCHFDWSRNFEGITASRYPSRVPQIIPFWSLYWIMMVHDYYWFTGEVEEVKKHLDGIASVLRWFESLIGSSGLVEKVPYWCVADWSPDWKDPQWGPGVPPGIKEGPSALVNFIFAYCLDIATALNLMAGKEYIIPTYRAQASRIRRRANEVFWSEKEGLYYDRPGGPEASQLTNAWAIVCGAAELWQQNRILRRLTDDPSLCRAALFGLFYVFRALSKAGAYDRVFDLLAPWRRMLDMGLTTWAETLDPETTRSDCHGWSCTPMYEFATKLLGVQPVAPGFSSVLIRPFPGYLTWARGSVPTPEGEIRVDWRLEGNRIILEGQAPVGTPVEVDLPGGERAKFSGGSFRVQAMVPARR